MVVAGDFPVMGTLLMVVIFVYAWIMDTAERKEAFENPRKPPVVHESFYVSGPKIQQMDRAFALD